jgi:hypothetical protein
MEKQGECVPHDLKLGEIIKWGQIEGCETAADIADAKTQPESQDDANNHEWADFYNPANAVGESGVFKYADDQSGALRGSRGSQVSQTIRQTVAGRSKKNARKKTGTRAARAKKD